MVALAVERVLENRVMVKMREMVPVAPERAEAETAIALTAPGPALVLAASVQVSTTATSWQEDYLRYCILLPVPLSVELFPRDGLRCCC